jgi:predicted dithiol-disulfide oxidoreductase (DUF899 family)
MTRPEIVSRSEWIAARKALLAREKELTRARDAVTALRAKLPMVKVEKEYRFETTDGPATLRGLFGDQPQLVVYHFMFDPAWEEGCKSCSHLLDNVLGSLVHLAARNTAFRVVSRAPLAKIEAFRRRMAWDVEWVSSGEGDFNYDFHVTLDPERGEYEYNYADLDALLAAKKIWTPKGELPGLSVFLREGDTVYHTYSVYQRGLDPLLNTYNVLDLTPLGRQEEDGRPQAWVRHRDRYGSIMMALADRPA